VQYEQTVPRPDAVCGRGPGPRLALDAASVYRCTMSKQSGPASRLMPLRFMLSDADSSFFAWSNICRHCGMDRSIHRSCGVSGTAGSRASPGRAASMWLYDAGLKSPPVHYEQTV
jgi:hypothetical protein